MSTNTYRIELAFDIAGDEEGAQQFAEWLETKGHEAKVGNSTASYVDGSWTYNDEDARAILESLWEEFCNSL